MNITEQQDILNTGTSIVLLVISFIGLVANFLVSIAFLMFRYWNKGSVILLFVNLLFCDTVQLLIISFYLVPEILCDFFTDSNENIVYSISLWFWYGTLSGYLFISTYCYFYACHSEKVTDWFTNIRVIIVLVISWLLSLVVSLSGFVGFGCANIILMNYASDNNNECETYHGFVANPLQIFTHCVNFVVIFWMTFCYISIVKHLKTIKPKDNRSLFVKIVNFNAETCYRRKRLLTLQFLTISSIFVPFCIVFLIANLSNINEVVTISQRLLFVLNSALPPLLLIKTTKSLRRDIHSILKVLTCRLLQSATGLTSAQPINLAAARCSDRIALGPMQHASQLNLAKSSSVSTLSTMDL